MFAVMRETDYYNKPIFRKNFWNDWRKLLGKKHVIQKLDDCDFTPIYEWHLEKKQVNKSKHFSKFFSLYDCIDVNYISKRLPFDNVQKNKDSKEKKPEQGEKYMWAIVDGVKEKVSFQMFSIFWDKAYLL